MAEADWQVMPGVGQQYLETISQGVRLWNRFGGETNDLARSSAEVLRTAPLIGARVVDDALREGSLENMRELVASGLGGEELREVGHAYVVSRTIERLAELGARHNLSRHERARLTVDKTRVMGITVTMKYVQDTDSLSGAVQLETGKVIPGNLMKLQARPELGGLVAFGNWWRGTYVHGLVNPATGYPRVKLEILTPAASD